MRILLADDQVWLRSAIRFLLEQEPDIEVVDEAADLCSLLAKAETTVPDVILLDWELPGLKAVGAGRQLLVALRTACPEVRVIVLSGHPEAGKGARAAGADAFVSKADPPDTLLAMVRRAASANQPRNVPGA